jgi:hypothetical protein
MVWFAFSAQDQVEKYGAYVGIAAFFGLAVLSLLYFSQARELKRLREWAGRAPERARELEQRVVAQATATVARRPPSAPAATGAAIAPPRRLAEMPAPPATQAAGAGQATELAEAVEGEPATNGNVPVPPVGPGGTVPAGRPENGAGDASQIAPPTEGAEPAANGAAAPAGDTDDDAAAPAGAGAAAGAAGAGAAAAGAGAAAAEGADDREETVPGEIPAATPAAAAVPRVTPAQRVGVTPRPQPLRQSAPTATPRGGGRRPAPPAGRRPGAAQPPREGRSAGTIALLVGLAVLILGGGTWGASQLLGGDDPQQQPNQPAPPATQTQEPGTSGGGGNAAQPSPPGETTVAVLNGTTSTGLAGALADQVEGEGYQRGAVATNPDQGIQESTVYYADGERATAREVAQLLSIENVEAIEPETQSLAPEADIVVLAGADQAP